MFSPKDATKMYKYNRMKNFLIWAIVAFLILSILFFLTKNNENFTSEDYNVPTLSEFKEILKNPQEIKKIRGEIPLLINEIMELEQKSNKRFYKPIVKLTPRHSVSGFNQKSRSKKSRSNLYIPY